MDFLTIFRTIFLHFSWNPRSFYSAFFIPNLSGSALTVCTFCMLGCLLFLVTVHMPKVRGFFGTKIFRTFVVCCTTASIFIFIFTTPKASELETKIWGRRNNFFFFRNSNVKVRIFSKFFQGECKWMKFLTPFLSYFSLFFIGQFSSFLKNSNINK